MTGSAGFLGHAVVSALAEHGHGVTALGRRDADVPDRADRQVLADVRSEEEVANAVAGVDAVCHLAALTSVRESFAEPLEYWRTNVVGTLNVLNAIVGAETPKRLVLASTRTTGNPYAATKLAADQAVAHVAAAGGVGAISLRAFNLAGATGGRGDRDRRRLIPKILAVQAGEADELVVNGDGSVIRDYVHVEDMADAFVRALDACAPGTWRAYDIGSGRRTSIRDVVAVAEQVTGKPVRLRHAPPADEPPVLVADPSEALADLGWRPTRSGLDRIIGDAWHAMGD